MNATSGPTFERISIELTNQCSKGCAFCYNGSHAGGASAWTPDDVVAFVRDCAAHGTRFVSFGGGEPLEYVGLYDVLERLEGVVFRSLTTNGLPLDDATIDRLVAARPDKVHISIHYPGNRAEVGRVCRRIGELASRGVATGVNLLVRRSELSAVARVIRALNRAGIEEDRIVFLPMRGADTPSPEELAAATGVRAFQSMTCLTRCGPSERFCSVDWSRGVGWCSYTTSRRRLETLDFAGLCAALDGLGLKTCGAESLNEPTRTGLDLLTYPFDEADRPSPGRVISTATIPAAHSMDTEWFAVDAEGHVALFDSFEPGVAPSNWFDAGLSEYHHLDLVGLIAKGNEPRDVTFDVADIVAMGPGRIFHGLYGEEPKSLARSVISLEEFIRLHELRSPPRRRSLIDMLLGRTWRETTRLPSLFRGFCWLRDETVAERLGAGCLVLPTREHTFAFFDSVETANLADMFRVGDVLSFATVDLTFAPWMARFGFYYFACDEYNGGPYDRIETPRTPCVISQLPASAQRVCNIVRFEDIQFRDVPRIQPFTHFPCRAYGGTWIDLQGNVHEVPGKSECE
ncbi:MAG TPA: radical SAM protein [Phycisphaerae bacterium]|nr:radical SAM protein [Phycisphaerae bacterium]HRW51494.1 radical SAM protein [Phycisphaerae bacterium]